MSGPAAASSMLEIEPESQAATLGSSGHSLISSELNSQAAVQYLSAAATSASPTDTRTQSSVLLESMTPTNAAAITARTVNASSRTVRLNWVNYLRSRWQQISSSNKMLLVFTMVLSAIQIVASLIAVATSEDGGCEKPLKIFLIVYTIRVVLSFPFSMYQYLHPRRRRNRRRRTRRSTTENPPQQSAEQHSQSLELRSQPLEQSSQEQPEGVPSLQPADPSPSQLPHANNAANTRRRNVLGARVDRAKSMLDLFATFWFVVGNYFLFGSTACANTASILFYVTLTWVILGYIMITIPILFCAAAIFCLPCVLVALRILQVGEPSETGGASPEEIKKIPVFRFTGDSYETNSIAESHISVKSTGGVAKPEQPSRVGFFRRLLLQRTRKSKPVDLETPRPKSKKPTISFDNSEDAVCAICLSNYEQDELVCRLWCQHHFHKDCLHEWLALNSTCPMCKQDSRGKEYEIMEEVEDD